MYPPPHMSCQILRLVRSIKLVRASFIHPHVCQVLRVGGSVHGLGSRAEGLGCGVQDSGVMGWELGFRRVV